MKLARMSDVRANVRNQQIAGVIQPSDISRSR
jgi:hypothetical protein